jgi:hypothetical protein
MRRSLTERLLDKEVVLIQGDLRGVAGVRVRREATDVLVGFDHDRSGNPRMFRLVCADFDAQPPSVAMVDPENRAELPLEAWSSGVPHSVHPVTNKPFVCLQGIAEYHSHPSHTSDSWDRYRNRFRLAQTVRRLLTKAGVIA